MNESEIKRGEAGENVYFNSPYLFLSMLIFPCHRNQNLQDDAKIQYIFYILNAKHYIFNCKMNNKIPDDIAFVRKFNFMLEVEFYILSKHNHDQRSISPRNIYMQLIYSPISNIKK